MAEKIILGIDPGTNVMGYGILRCEGRKVEAVTLGALQMKKTESHYLRLKQIRDKVLELIDEYLPDELAIESPYFGINVASVVKLCRAQGAAMTAALDRDIPVCEYPPSRVKMAITGNGNAAKEQVAAMVLRVLKLDKPEVNDIAPQVGNGRGKTVPLDATDALAIALTHYYETSKGLPTGAFGNKSKGWEKKRGKSTSWETFVQANQDKVHK